MAFALVAATVGALSLMSVTSTAYGKEGADDSSGDDRGGRGRGSDDGAGDDHGRRHGGHGADDGIARSGDSAVPLGQIAADWEAQGWHVLQIEREDGTLVEVDAVDPKGIRYEMLVDTATNKILSQRLDD